MRRARRWLLVCLAMGLTVWPAGTTASAEAVRPTATTEQSVADETEPNDSFLTEEQQEALWDELPAETREALRKQGIESPAINADTLSLSGIFTHLFEGIKSGIVTPFRVCLLLFFAVLTAAGLAVFSEANHPLAELISGLSVCTVLGAQIMALMQSVFALLRVMTGTLTALIPVMAGALAASGRGVTAAGMSGMLLLAADGVTVVASYFVAPLLSCLTALTLCGGVWNQPWAVTVCDTVRRVALWGLTLSTTVFSAVLGLKGVLYAAADSVAVKTVQFLLSGVPAAGSVLSGSLTAVLAGLKAVKQTLWAFGAVALSAAAGPALVQALCWHLALSLLHGACQWFGFEALTQITAGLKQIVSLLAVLTVLSAALCIIGLGVVASV